MRDEKFTLLLVQSTFNSLFWDWLFLLLRGVVLYSQSVSMRFWA